MCNGFFFIVIISRFSAEYCSEFWIPYEIECTVVTNLPETALSAGLNLLASELNDMTSAAGFGIDLDDVLTFLNAPGATVRGTLPYASAERSLANAQNRIASGLSEAGSRIGSSDFETVLTASEQLATYSAARGYAARAAVNFARAST
jgi:hypothetical protein